MQFNLADLFEHVVDTVPDREALVCGDRRLTFAQLDARANRLAHYLQACGLGKDDHIGVYLYNGTEHVETLLAAWKIRAVPININYRYVEDELAYLCADADVQAVVHHREFCPRLAAIRHRLPRLRSFVVVQDGSGADCRALDSVDYEEALAGASSGGGFGERSGDDRYILYTGGTTGLPKGVLWRHEDIFFAALSGGNPGGTPIELPEQVADIAHGGGLVSLPVAPLMHASGQWGSFTSLLGGNKVVLWPLRHLDPPEVWKVIEREGVNTVTFVGDAVSTPMLDELERGSYDTSSLLAVASGGTILTPKVKERILRLVPHAVVVDAFGSSETGAQGTTVTAKGGGPPPGLRFTLDSTTQVLGEDLKPIPPGSGKVGRLARRGRIPVGYYNDPDKTAATFVQIDGERWAFPGDMATVDADGSIVIIGRGSLSINTGGEKVYPDEVEAALRAHPDVADALVVGVPDERWGERVAAVVQPRPGRTPSLDDLDAHCRSRLAGYKIPRVLHLVETVERSPAGKGDYRWAREVAEAATPQ